MAEEKAKAVSVSLYPSDIAVLRQVAKDTAQTGLSGGLRYVIRRFVEIERENDARAQCES